MNKIVECALLICLVFSISIYLYFVCSKNVSSVNLSELNSTQSGLVTSKTPTESSYKHRITDEDVKYLQDKGWDVYHVRYRRQSRNKRSLASIANCVWRVLNYPYMYNFYPILNFGVSKIMSGIGDLINNVHFPLFSSTSSTTSQQPLSDSELQAKELANAQGKDLSQEGTTPYQDYNSDVKAIPNTTPSQEYPDSKEQEEEEEEKERQAELKEKLRAEEVNKKIDEKAAILAKKYVQMYFSQNKQQLPPDAMSNTDDNVVLPVSIENELDGHTTDLYDLNTPNNYALPNNLPAYN